MTQRNDATKSTKAIVHQFYVALDEAFNLEPNEKLYIETWGDITRGDSQIEVKDFDPDDRLTNKHKNFWNTLFNWISPTFDPNYYKNLVLLTTQKFGVKSDFKEWNKKSINEKLALLEKIKNNIDCSNEKLSHIDKQICEILNPSNRKKLKNILDKFIIDNADNDSLSIISKVNKNYFSIIPTENRVSATNQLLGYLISPQIVICNGWEISYDSFKIKRIEVGRLFSEGASLFPERPKNYCASQDFTEHLFVKKIKDIEYKEVVEEACADYWHTRKLDFEDLKNRNFSRENWDSFEKSVLSDFNRNSRQCKRINEDIIKKSQMFYDEVTGEEPPSLGSFPKVEKYYRNGKLHELADERDNSIKWYLGD